jgi:hypothetical protein
MGAVLGLGAGYFKHLRVLASGLIIRRKSAVCTPAACARTLARGRELDRATAGRRTVGRARNTWRRQDAYGSRRPNEPGSPAQNSSPRGASVFRAWTDPEVLMRWWWKAVPAGMEMDLRVGGAYRIGMRRRSGGRRSTWAARSSRWNAEAGVHLAAGERVRVHGDPRDRAIHGTGAETHLLLTHEVTRDRCMPASSRWLDRGIRAHQGDLVEKFRLGREPQ